MDVIEQYFKRLRVFLPKDQRDDIVNELSGEIRAQAAEQAQRVGRALTNEEQSALIAHFGHPMLLAARYWPQRYLIGPVLYPYYWPVLKVAIGLTIGVHLIAAVVLAMTGQGWPELGRSFARVWDAGLAVFAWTTWDSGWSIGVWPPARSSSGVRLPPQLRPRATCSKSGTGACKWPIARCGMSTRPCEM